MRNASAASPKRRRSPIAYRVEVEPGPNDPRAEEALLEWLARPAAGSDPAAPLDVAGQT